MTMTPNFVAFSLFLMGVAVGTDGSETCPNAFVRPDVMRWDGAPGVLLMQTGRGKIAQSLTASCCCRCTVQGFCSPQSGNCYDSKAKEYYEDCRTEGPTSSPTPAPSPTPSSTPTPTSSPAPVAALCCSACTGNQFCSPVSGNCYDSKSRDYYEDCGPQGPVPSSAPAPSAAPVAATCCERCERGIPGFCSPRSGACYESKAKDYYGACPQGGSATPTLRLPLAPSSEGSIRLMSYNLFGWNAFNQNMWRSENILEKIRNFDPAVLGAQEVETGGGNGGETVSRQITSSTSLSGGVGGGQFFKSSALDAHETESFNLVRGYWMSMTRFTHKATNVHFLFFNSHWKHGYGGEQKVIIADAVAEQRAKYGSPPTILVGDTNQFCMAADGEAIKYLKGEEGSSPVVFVDAHAQDKGSSYDGGCRIDFILASAGQWMRVQSSIDREGMGQQSTASDHAALMAELVPIAGDVSLAA